MHEVHERYDKIIPKTKISKTINFLDNGQTNNNAYSIKVLAKLI